MKSILIKSLLTGLTTLTVAGGLVAYNWSGSETLNNAKAKIGEYVSSINVFKDNETKLITKVGELNTQIDDLKEQLANGVGDSEQLKKQIAELTAERDALQSEKANLESDLTDAVNKLEEANLQVDKANKQAEELQVYIDGLGTTPQAQDISGLVGTTPTPPPAGNEDPVKDPNNDLTWTIKDGNFNDGHISIEVVGTKYKVTNLDGQNAQPLYLQNGAKELQKGASYEYADTITSLQVSDYANYTKTITIIK